MTHSEILKAAHRQAKRLAVGISYRQALSIAMADMYAAAKSAQVACVGRGYSASLCHTLSRSQRDQIAA